MPNNGFTTEKLVRALLSRKLFLPLATDLLNVVDRLDEFERKFGDKFDKFIENRLIGFVITEIRKPCERKGNPTDIELVTATGEVLKISVKYSSYCWLNSSPKLFYSNKNKLRTLRRYISNRGVEVILIEREYFGKNNEPTYIRLKRRMKREVADQWNLFTTSEKKAIIRKCFHYEETPDFEFYFTKVNMTVYEYGRMFIEILNDITDNIDKINLVPSRNSDYVFIRYEGNDIGKIQVKFNNGVENKSLRYNFWVVSKYKKSILQRLL